MLIDGNILYPYIVTAVPLALVMFYPSWQHWSTARSDSTLILGVGSGTALALWVVTFGGFSIPTVDRQSYSLSAEQIMYNMFSLKALLRILVGSILLVSVRTIMKFVTVFIFSTLAGHSFNDPRIKQLVSVQLPCKFITYTCIAFAAVFIAPVLFNSLGIIRPGFFSEYLM